MSNEYFIVLDALRSDHVSHMPWLKSKINSSLYVENIQISSGFCERSEIFTGMSPRSSSFLNAFDYNFKNNLNRPYGWIKNWQAYFLTFFEKNDLAEKIIRRILWEISKKKSLTPFYSQRIPYKLLNKIVLTEDSVDFLEISKKQKSGLLYFFTKKNYEIDFSFFTSFQSDLKRTDFERLDYISKSQPKYNNKFIPIYIGLPDHIGHVYGPNSEEMIINLKNLDRSLEKFYLKCLSIDKNSSFSFLGDHGMEHVIDAIDIEKIINKISSENNLQKGKDFYYFLDSTMLRIWWVKEKNNKIDKFIKQFYNNNEVRAKGYLNDDIDAVNEDIPEINNIADIVWWAKKGTIIFPNFFQNGVNNIKGMHGYLKRDSISSGFFLRTKKDLQPKYISNFDIKKLDELC